MSAAAKSSTLAKLDAIRGLAALFVALGHTAGYTLLINYSVSIFALGTERDVIIRLFVGSLSAQGAVIVLFLVSGFVLGRSLDRLNGAALSATGYAGFLFRRSMRLYPAYAVAVLAIALIGWLFLGSKAPIDFSPYPSLDDGQSVDWLNGTVFTPLKLKSIVGNLAVMSWSLNLVAWSVYVQFCVAPLLPLFHGLARIRRRPLDLAVIAALLALSYALGEPAWASYWFVFYLGMLVESWGRDWTRLVANRLGAVGLWIAVSYLLMAMAPVMFKYQQQAVIAAEALAGFSLVSLIVWRGGEIRALGFLDNPLLRWLGRVSYSFYLWHYFVLTLAVRQLFVLIPAGVLQQCEWSVFAAMAIATVGVSLAIAQVSRMLIELPCLSRGRALVDWWQASVAKGRLRTKIATTREPTAPMPGWAAASSSSTQGD